MGSQVLLSTIHLPVLAGQKLGQRWMDPFGVVKGVNAIAYELLLPPTLQVNPVFHASLLWAYDDRGEHQHTFPLNPIHMAGASEHVVARVLHHRHPGRGLQYLVEWEWYDVADTTWEQECHLANAPDRVSEYLEWQGTCSAGWLNTPEDASDLASSEGSSVEDGPQPGKRWKWVLPPCQDD